MHSGEKKEKNQGGTAGGSGGEPIKGKKGAPPGVERKQKEKGKGAKDL